MKYIILSIAVFVIIKFINKVRKRNKLVKQHNMVEAELTPIAFKFDLNPRYVLTKKIIDNKYYEIRDKMARKEKVNFQDFDDLENSYEELLKKAKLRDLLMYEMTKDSGRQVEFYD